MRYYIKTYAQEGDLNNQANFYESEPFNNLEDATNTAKSYLINYIQSKYHTIDKIDDLENDPVKQGKIIEIKSTTGENIDFNTNDFIKDYLLSANRFNTLNTPTIYQRVLRFAAEKHNGQPFANTGLPYLYHIACVASEIYAAGVHMSSKDEFNLNYALTLALLHDTVEDTSTVEAELQQEFGDFVAWGVQALTKNENCGENAMQDSIERILNSPKEVAMVKLADRITNLMPPPTSWDKNKINNYHKQAKLIYEQLGGSSLYLGDRLKNKIVEYESYL